MNWKIPPLPQKRTRTAFRGSFVSRHIKPAIIAKKTDMLLNGPPFGAVPYFLNKIRDAGFDKVVLVATSPSAVSACQKAVESVERGELPIIEQLTWLDFG